MQNQHPFLKTGYRVSDLLRAVGYNVSSSQVSSGIISESDINMAIRLRRLLFAKCKDEHEYRPWLKQHRLTGQSIGTLLTGFCNTRRYMPLNMSLGVFCENQTTSLLTFCLSLQYLDLLQLDVGDSAQVHAAFLVFMDLTEGEAVFF